MTLLAMLVLASGVLVLRAARPDRAAKILLTPNWEDRAWYPLEDHDSIALCELPAGARYRLVIGCLGDSAEECTVRLRLTPSADLPTLARCAKSDVAQISAAKRRRNLAGGDNPRLRSRGEDRAPEGRRSISALASNVGLSGLSNRSLDFSVGSRPMSLALESSRHIPCAVSLGNADGTWNVPATLLAKRVPLG